MFSYSFQIGQYPQSNYNFKKFHSNPLLLVVNAWYTYSFPDDQCRKINSILGSPDGTGRPSVYYTVHVVLTRIMLLLELGAWNVNTVHVWCVECIYSTCLVRGMYIQYILGAWNVYTVHVGCVECIYSTCWVRGMWMKWKLVINRYQNISNHFKSYFQSFTISANRNWVVATKSNTYGYIFAIWWWKPLIFQT